MSERSLSLLESLAAAGAERALIAEPCEVVREIVASDIPLVVQEMREHNWARANGAGEAHDLRSLRAGHHQLAQVLAAGVGDVEASLVTGKSTTTIASLKRDPAFKELLAYYTAQQEVRDYDMHARVTTIGAIASEILQERLEESPDKFSNEDLRKLLDLAKPGGEDSGARMTSGVSVAINFVPAPARNALDETGTRTIEARVTDEAKNGS